MLPDKNRYFLFFFFLLKEPGKELWDGCMLQKQHAAGHWHPEPHSYLLKEQVDGQEKPQNNPAGISPAAGLPTGETNRCCL